MSAFAVGQYVILTGSSWGSHVGLMPFSVKSPDQGSLVKVAGFDIARQMGYFTDDTGQDWVIQPTSGEWGARVMTPAEILAEYEIWARNHGAAKQGTTEHSEALHRLIEYRNALLDLLGERVD